MPSTTIAAPSTPSIGQNVRHYRHLAGWTQQQLADRAGYQPEYISMIETGRRAVRARDTVIRLADALGVSFTDLTGQPVPPTEPIDLAGYMAVAGIRTALSAPITDREPAPLDRLAQTVRHAMAARMACNYAQVGEILPGVLLDARTHLAVGGPHAADAADVYVRACLTGSLMLRPMGWIDLAWRLADQGIAAAANGSPELVAATTYALAQCALSAGQQHLSYQIARDGAARLASPVTDDEHAWRGLLDLHAALSAASLDDRDLADGHLDDADAAARRIGPGGDSWLMEFGVPNVGIWRLSILAENPGDNAHQGPLLARRVDESKVRTVQRRGRLHMDLGRVLHKAGDFPGAVRAFHVAGDISLVELRGRASVRELVAAMVRGSRTRVGDSELGRLAVRMGIDPMNPPPPDERELI